jgi:hypothetical protein
MKYKINRATPEQIERFVEFAKIVRLQHKQMAVYLNRNTSNGLSIAIRRGIIKPEQIALIRDKHLETLEEAFSSNLKKASHVILGQMQTVPYRKYDPIVTNIFKNEYNTNQEVKEFVEWQRKEIIRAFKLVENI